MPHPKMLSAYGRIQSMADWARETGLPYPLLKDRIRSGWAVEEALTRSVSDGVKRGRASPSSRNGKGLRKFSDWVGETINRLTIEEYIPGCKREKIRPMFRCRCSCGTVDHYVTPYNLLYVDATKRGSCGCLVTERVTEMNVANTKHRMSGDPIYLVWNSMIQRCHNENDASYSDYGGRGISVCPQWRASFSAFYADMGPRPEGGTLERRDNFKGYDPENCIWASHQQQMNNTRQNHNLSAFGKTQTVARWCRELNIPRPFIDYRLRRGVTLEVIVVEFRSKPRGESS